MCSCGCNTCGGKAPLLKEGKTFQQPLSENLLYHINKKKPLLENTFRYGSPAFLNLWKEARTLYSRGVIDVGPEDKQILIETSLGEYGIYEGELVPLDLPMLYEQPIEEAQYQGKNVELNKPHRGGPKKYYVYVMNPKTKKVKKVNFGGTTGLNVKIDDPKARHSFAARHKCAQEKNKLSPNYWGCHIGRYWKSLGGSKNFSGYW